MILESYRDDEEPKVPVNPEDAEIHKDYLRYLADEEEHKNWIKKTLLHHNPLALCTLEEINEIYDKENPDIEQPQVYANPGGAEVLNRDIIAKKDAKPQITVEFNEILESYSYDEESDK